MTAPAQQAPPQPCHEDPRLGELVLPTPEEHADLERRIAAAVAGSHMQAARAAGVAAPVAAPPLELARTLSRTQLYPDANHTAQWFSNAFDSVEFSFLRAVVLHTTETAGWPGYGGGGSAPTLTALPDVANKRLIWRQHFRLGESARALVNAPGGVNTNTTNVVQIELVGTCAAGGPGLHWPTAPDWALAELAKFLRWLRASWGVQLTSTVRWEAYPGSYGLNNGERLSASAWLSYRGLLAHEHVPENDHGDCGLFRMSRLLQFCNPATPQEDPMPTADEIADAVWSRTVTSTWDGKERGVLGVLNSTHFYAIQAGASLVTPDTATTSAKQPTTAKEVLDTLDAQSSGQADLATRLDELAAQQAQTQQLLQQLLAAQKPPTS
jgi:hypothetical protein